MTPFLHPTTTFRRQMAACRLKATRAMLIWAAALTGSLGVTAYALAHDSDAWIITAAMSVCAAGGLVAAWHEKRECERYLSE